MTHPILTTARLTLTPVALTDFEALQSLWSDDRFTRAITGRSLSREEVWFRLLRDIGHWSALGHGNWTMCLTESGAYVGSVGVLNYRRDLEPAFDVPELGWGVGGDYQGQGLAREGLDAALAWADTTANLVRTVCMIAPDNHPSLTLAGRVGYRPYADATYKDHPVILMQRFNAVTDAV